MEQLVVCRRCVLVELRTSRLVRFPTNVVDFGSTDCLSRGSRSFDSIDSRYLVSDVVSRYPCFPLHLCIAASYLGWLLRLNIVFFITTSVADEAIHGCERPSIE